LIIASRVTFVLSEISPYGSLFALLGPATIAILAFGFLLTWLFDRKRTYLLILAGGFFAFSIGSAVQISQWPRNFGLHVMIPGALYTVCVLSLAEGVARRGGERMTRLFLVVVASTIIGLTFIFYYVSDNVVARIYTQNFGAGITMLLATRRMQNLRRGKLIDQVIFWIFTFIAIHFFPRVAATIGLNVPIGEVEFETSPFWIAFHISAALLGVMMSLALLAGAMIDRIDELRADRDADSLTGLLNRRGFDERGDLLLGDLSARPVSIIVADIDNFKNVNDNYGHAAGDQILQSFAMTAAKRLQNGDVGARIGGEEFAFLLRQCPPEKAHGIADRIRIVFQTRRPFADVGPQTVTASFGIAEAKVGETLWQLVRRADKMLYEAKRSGRNSVFVWGAPADADAVPPLAPDDNDSVMPIRRLTGRPSE